MRYKSKLVVFVLFIIIQQVVSRRGSSGGRQRTSPRTTPRSTQQHQQSNSYQVGNPNNNNPSSPVLQPQSNQNPIGFDNVNRQSATNTHPIGFDNVQNRVPPQNNQPPPGFNNGYHPPQQQYGGNNPQVQQQSGSVPNHQTQYSGYNPQGQQPPGTWNHAPGGYNPQGPQYGGYTPHGGYNPYMAQPGSYYNNYATQGIQPQLYQPQQSSGFGAGSLLGIAGSFGGGYLLGRLTSGGHEKENKDSGSSSSSAAKNEQQFVVHHYYHNANEVPKQITVSNSSVVTCVQNGTQNLCVPNTFPLCLSNGTIMCVTHTRFTVPCGSNAAMACIVTALPCNSKEKSCNSASNLSTTVVYVPCVSNVTISGQNETSLGNDLCVTAIAEPVKKLESPVPSLVNLMTMFATMPYNLYVFPNTTFSNMTTITPDIKTELPPTLKVSDS